MSLLNHLRFNSRADDWFYAPVLTRFFDAGAPFTMVEHSLRDGTWDMPALLDAHPEGQVLRRLDNVERGTDSWELDRMLLRLECNTFVIWDDPALYVIASDRKTAYATMSEMASRFFKLKRHRNKPTFHVICQECGETVSASVPVKRPFLRKAADFELHYGIGFSDFHHHLMARMKRVRQGVAVLRGEPGTGKTTYIRALMWQLRRSHRFYTIPLQEFTRMTASDLTSFWLDEKKSHEKQTIVLVIEDAEGLIRGDGGERPPQIATLLNLSDGLIGELLEFQILVTVNCPLEDIDPAITRRGRLMAYHEFRRLNAGESKRVALRHKLELPEPESDSEWTLAEIFNLAEAAPYERKEAGRMGF